MKFLRLVSDSFKSNNPHYAEHEIVIPSMALYKCISTFFCQPVGDDYSGCAKLTYGLLEKHCYFLYTIR